MPQQIIFSPDIITQIIEKYKSGLSCKAIGKELGCSKQKINAVLRENGIEIRPSNADKIVIFIVDGKEMRNCSECNQEKEIEEFYFRMDTDQYDSKCKECKAKIHKEWSKNRIITVKEFDNGQTKKCRLCNTIKPILEYQFRKDTGKFGNDCKECVSNRNKEWRETRIIPVREFNEEIDMQQCIMCGETKLLKEFYFRTDSGRYRTDCKECNNEQSKEFRLEHIEELNKYHKIYRSIPENKERARNKANERRIIDPEYAFKKDVSSIVARILRQEGGSKNGQSTWKRIGWTYEIIIDFFEKVYFTLSGNEWMNRYNRGEYDPDIWNDKDPATFRWHLDHIIPHSFFHYSSFDHPDFLLCWALKNLRPLNAKQNVQENNRRTDEEIKQIQDQLEERLILLNYKL